MDNENNAADISSVGMDMDEAANFAVCVGPVTDEEKQFLLKTGQIYEKNGQLLNVSTLTESGFEDDLDCSVASPLGVADANASLNVTFTKSVLQDSFNATTSEMQMEENKENITPAKEVQYKLNETYDQLPHETDEANHSKVLNTSPDVSVVNDSFFCEPEPELVNSVAVDEENVKTPTNRSPRASRKSQLKSTPTKSRSFNISHSLLFDVLTNEAATDNDFNESFNNVSQVEDEVEADQSKVSDKDATQDISINPMMFYERESNVDAVNMDSSLSQEATQNVPISPLLNVTGNAQAQSIHNSPARKSLTTPRNVSTKKLVSTPGIGNMIPRGNAQTPGNLGTKQLFATPGNMTPRGNVSTKKLVTTPGNVTVMTPRGNSTKKLATTPANMTPRGNAQTPGNLGTKQLFATPGNMTPQINVQTPGNLGTKELFTTPANTTRRNSQTPGNVSTKKLTTTPANMTPQANAQTPGNLGTKQLFATPGNMTPQINVQTPGNLGTKQLFASPGNMTPRGNVSTKKFATTPANMTPQTNAQTPGNLSIFSVLGTIETPRNLTPRGARAWRRSLIKETPTFARSFNISHSLLFDVLTNEEATDNDFNESFNNVSQGEEVEADQSKKLDKDATQDISINPMMFFERESNVDAVNMDGSCLSQEDHVKQSRESDFMIGLDDISDATQNVSISPLLNVIGNAQAQNIQNSPARTPLGTPGNRSIQDLRRRALLTPKLSRLSLNPSMTDNGNDENVGMGLEVLKTLRKENSTLSSPCRSVSGEAQNVPLDLLLFDQSVEGTNGSTQNDDTDKSRCESDRDEVICEASPETEKSVNLMQLDVSCCGNNMSNLDDGREDLDMDDTIDLMDKLIAQADELEALEALTQTTLVKATPMKGLLSASMVPPTPTPSPKPLKARRVLELKGRGNLFSPSPPRPGPSNRTGAWTPTFKTPTPAPRPPQQKVFVTPPTPRRRSFANVPAKVDSGLRKSPVVSLGLDSPVADYIHSKAVPSPFQRVIGVPIQQKIMSAQKPASQKLDLVNSMIPRPSLPSYGLTSASKHNSRLTTGTETETENYSKFKQHQYTGPKSTMLVNSDSFIEKHQKENYIAQRHMGVRDENVDTSILQNTVIPKKFLQSKYDDPDETNAI